MQIYTLLIHSVFNVLFLFFFLHFFFVDFLSVCVSASSVAWFPAWADVTELSDCLSLDVEEILFFVYGKLSVSFLMAWLELPFTCRASNLWLVSWFIWDSFWSCRGRLSTDLSGFGSWLSGLFVNTCWWCKLGWETEMVTDVGMTGLDTSWRFFFKQVSGTAVQFLSNKPLKNMKYWHEFRYLQKCQ